MQKSNSRWSGCWGGVQHLKWHLGLYQSLTSLCSVYPYKYLTMYRRHSWAHLELLSKLVSALLHKLTVIVLVRELRADGETLYDESYMRQPSLSGRQVFPTRFGTLQSHEKPMVMRKWAAFVFSEWNKCHFGISFYPIMKVQRCYIHII